MSQKLILACHEITDLSYLLNDKKEIVGSQVRIGKHIFEMPSLEPENFLFKKEFTCSDHRKILNENGEMIGQMLEIQLNSKMKELPQSEIQMIYRRNERTLINIVPDRPEYQFPEAENKMWLLRPEEKYGSMSELHNATRESPDEVKKILNGCRCDRDISSLQGQAPSLIQELLVMLCGKSKEFILKDSNIPVPSDFSQDLSLRSPLTLCFENKTQDEISSNKSTINQLFRHFCMSAQSEYNDHLVKMEVANILDCNITFDYVSQLFIESSVENTSSCPKAIAHFEKGRHKLGEHANKQFSIRHIKASLIMYNQTQAPESIQKEDI